MDVALDGSPDPETATKVRAIEAALDALLRTMIRDRRERAERRSAAGPSATPLRAIHISELLAMSADQLELDDLLDDPVGAACRKGVRRCGKALHKLGGLELMRDACDSVAERDPDTWGYRTSIMDSAWNGVGSDDGGRWWS